MQQPAPNISEEASLITKGEVARMTSVSARTIERLVSMGQFPQPVRLGRKSLWNRQKLQAWIADGCKAIRD